MLALIGPPWPILSLPALPKYQKGKTQRIVVDFTVLGLNPGPPMLEKRLIPELHPSPLFVLFQRWSLRRTLGGGDRL